MAIGTIKKIVLLPLLASLTACGGFIANSGPSRSAIESSSNAAAAIAVIPVTGDLIARLGPTPVLKFSDAFASSLKAHDTLGPGDMLEVTLWETPPAVLFSTASVQSLNSGKELSLPEQMVDSNGDISVPFVGSVHVQGKTSTQVQREIVARLTGRANKPQAFVRQSKINNATVTIVSSTGTNKLLPLTAKKERLLDAITVVGGMNDSLSHMTVQLTRQDRVVAMPLEDIVKDPRQNIYLNAGDVVSIMNQPQSYTVMGASHKNEEIHFESKGINLSQALGRAGGLDDFRSDAKGVFVFRYEDPARLNGFTSTNSQHLIDGKVPVIYEVNLKDPQAFFWAQKFAIKDSDTIYISNAPSAELNKFINIISGSIYSIIGAKGLGL